MAAKQIAYEMEARESIRRGVSQLARAVRATLGPCGRNVVIEKSFGAPTVTKDGVTVAKEIELEEAYENMGAQMVKEVASKTSNVAGDGTTTATIYAEAIYDEGLKNIAAGAEAMELKRGVEQAVSAIVDELKKMSSPVKDSTQITQVGTCAANQNAEIVLLSDNRDADGAVQFEKPATTEVAVRFPAPLLVPGQYSVTPAVSREGQGSVDAQQDAVSFEIVDVKGVRSTRAGYMHVPLEWEVV